jgi:hypothetical protein
MCAADWRTASLARRTVSRGRWLSRWQQTGCRSMYRSGRRLPINNVKRALHAIGCSASKDDRHRGRHRGDRRHQRKAAHVVRQSGKHVAKTILGSNPVIPLRAAERLESPARSERPFRNTSRRLSRVSPACEISACKYRPVEPRNASGRRGHPRERGGNRRDRSI